ncbi:MAG: hypothetical protein HKP41_05935 [Desulfobacterales bacterium]|nr:hypothetical protein [Desulfobacterales bacterium]
MSKLRLVIILLSICYLSQHLLSEIIAEPATLVYASSTTITSAEQIWEIDFTALPNNVRQELTGQGFSFEKGMSKGKKIHIVTDDNNLKISTTRPAFGFMIKKDLQIQQANWLEIEWGIERYPEAANWDNSKNREAVMVYLFFGDPLPADHFYLPDSPFFIGMFLGKHEVAKRPYIGGNYTATGRYVCLDNPAPGQLITSRFNYSQAFKTWFDQATTPPVTGIAIEVDTGGLPDGLSSAFIKRITFQNVN